MRRVISYFVKKFEGKQSCCYVSHIFLLHNLWIVLCMCPSILLTSWLQTIRMMFMMFVQIQFPDVGSSIKNWWWFHGRKFTIKRTSVGKWNLNILSIFSHLELFVLDIFVKSKMLLCSIKQTLDVLITLIQGVPLKIDHKLAATVSNWSIFWFGLPFGSPNPTCDFVTDDDDVNVYNHRFSILCRFPCQNSQSQILNSQSQILNLYPLNF